MSPPGGTSPYWSLNNNPFLSLAPPIVTLSSFCSSNPLTPLYPTPYIKVPLKYLQWFQFPRTLDWTLTILVQLLSQNNTDWGAQETEIHFSQFWGLHV